MRLFLISFFLFPFFLSAHPMADFSSSTDVACPGEEVHFFDESFPSGAIAFWSWDFDGGKANATHIPNPTVSFDSSGFYTITLTVVDTHGHADTEQKQAYIYVDSIPRLGIDASKVPAERRWQDSTCLEEWEDSAYCREFWIVKYDSAVSVSGDGLVEGGEYFCPDSAGLGEASITFSASSHEGCFADTTYTTYVGRCEEAPSGISGPQAKTPPSLTYDPLMKELRPSRELKRFHLFDAKGRLLRRGGRTERIDMSGFPPGIYLLRGKGWSQKFMVH